MINSCIEHDEVFGVVLLRSGAETESEDTIHRVGVTARIVQVERLDNGRLNILTEGEDRFRIRRLTAQEPFWKGLVDFSKTMRVTRQSRPCRKKYRNCIGKLLNWEPRSIRRKKPKLPCPNHLPICHI